MHKHTRTKLSLSRDTIRHLATSELARAQGGASQLATCSMCLAGCDTGNACPQVIDTWTNPVTDEPSFRCWPDPPPR